MSVNLASLKLIRLVMGIDVSIIWSPIACTLQNCTTSACTNWTLWITHRCYCDIGAFNSPSVTLTRVGDIPGALLAVWDATIVLFTIAVW